MTSKVKVKIVIADGEEMVKSSHCYEHEIVEYDKGDTDRDAMLALAIYQCLRDEEMGAWPIKIAKEVLRLAEERKDD